MGVLWEHFMMQWAGGVEIAWKLLGEEKVKEHSVLYAYWMWLMWGVPELYKIMGPSFARMVAHRIHLGENGTDLLVGHDTNMIMIKGALGLTWKPEPFAANATLPGSMLRFDRIADKIKASFWFVANFSSDEGTMHQVPAEFASTGSDQITVAKFVHLLTIGSSPTCSIRVDDIPLVPDPETFTSLMSGRSSSDSSVAQAFI